MSLHGNWRPIRAELDGEEAPAMALERMELRLAHDGYTVNFADAIYDKGRLIVTATTLTLIGQHGEQDGRVILAQYQLVGDRLRICYGLDGVEPVEFKTSANSRRYLVTYRRVSAL